MAGRIVGPGAAIIWALAVSPLLAGPAKIAISSPAFASGQSIPSKYSCDGENTNPPLQIASVPAAAKSLVLIADDPDAPGGLFTHWLVWNIDPKTNSIGEGSAPNGTQGKNGFGKLGYGGPCPPSGTHRYFFKVFALDKTLELSAGASRKQLDAAMQGHVVGEGELMGRYARKK